MRELLSVVGGRHPLYQRSIWNSFKITENPFLNSAKNNATTSSCVFGLSICKSSVVWKISICLATFAKSFCSLSEHSRKKKLLLSRWCRIIIHRQYIFIAIKHNIFFCRASYRNRTPALLSKNIHSHISTFGLKYRSATAMKGYLFWEFDFR